MKGKILGTSSDGGTISAEDGKRYKFELMQWNNDRPPALSQEVDFEVDVSGRAVEVFLLRSGPDFELGQAGAKLKGLIGDGAATPLGGRLIALASGNPVFQISVALVVASVFFSFIKLTGGVIANASALMPDNGTYSVANIGDLIDFLKASLEQGATSVDQIGGMLGSLSPTPGSNGHDLANGLRSIEALTNLFYIAYLVPLGALAIIVQSLRARAIGLLALGTGIASIASFIGLFIWRWAIVSGMRSVGNELGATLADQSIHYGFGAFIILICGVLLVGSALGLIRLPQKA